MMRIKTALNGICAGPPLKTGARSAKDTRKVIGRASDYHFRGANRQDQDQHKIIMAQAEQMAKTDPARAEKHRLTSALYRSAKKV